MIKECEGGEFEQFQFCNSYEKCYLTNNIEKDESYNPICATCNQNDFLLNRQVANVSGVAILANTQESLTIVKIDASSAIVARLTDTLIIIGATAVFCSNPASWTTIHNSRNKRWR